MKKQILMILSLSLLTSCNANTSSILSVEDNSSISSSIMDSSSRQPTTPVYEWEQSTYGIYDGLSLMGDNGIYRLNYEVEGQEYHDVYSFNYYYLSISRSGGVMTNYYNQKEIRGEVMYSYTLDEEDHVKIGSVLNYNGKPSQSLDDVNTLSLLNKAKEPMLPSHIKQSQDGIFYSDDILVITVLAAITGHTTEALNELYNQVVFSFDEEDKSKLYFSIQGLSLDGSGKEVEYVKASFEDVNYATEEKIDAYLSHYKIPAEAIEKEKTNILLSDSLTSKSSVYLHLQDEPKSLALESTLSFNNDYLSITSEDKLDQSVSSTLFKKGENGNALEIGIDANNQLAYNDMEIKWDDLNWPSTSFDATAFRKTGENTYHYFGAFTTSLFYSFTYLNLGIQSMDMVISNDEISLVSTTGLDSDDNYNTFYYTINTTFSSTATIKELKPFAHQEENDQIQTSLDQLKAGKQFRYQTYDYSGNSAIQTEVIVDKDIVYINSTNNDVTSRFGFVQKDNRIIPFDVTTENNKNVVTIDEETLASLDEEVTLDDIIGMNLSADVLTINQNGNYIPKDHVINLSSSIIGGPFSEYMIPSSLEMMVDSQTKNISSLRYLYSYTDAFGQQTYGYDIVRFDQYGTAVVPPILASQIRSLGFNN